MCTIDSLYNEPRGEMENSSLHREFIIPKNPKIKKIKKPNIELKREERVKKNVLSRIKT